MLVTLLSAKNVVVPDYFNDSWQGCQGRCRKDDNVKLLLVVSGNFIVRRLFYLKTLSFFVV